MLEIFEEFYNNFSEEDKKAWEEVSEHTKYQIKTTIRAFNKIGYSLSFFSLCSGKYNDNGDRSSELTFWDYKNNINPEETSVTLKI